MGHIDTTFWTRFDRTEESLSDRRYLEEGQAYINDHRARLPVVIGARLGRTWNFFRPLEQLQLDLAAGNSSIWLYRGGLAFFWATAPFAVLGALRLRARRTVVFPLLVPLLVVTTSTVITFGQTRFRAPAEVSLCILAAVGVHAVLRALHERVPRAHGVEVEAMGVR